MIVIFQMKMTSYPMAFKLPITSKTVIKKDGVIMGFDEFQRMTEKHIGKEYDIKFILNPVFMFSDGKSGVSMDVKEIILKSIESEGNDNVDPDDPGTSLSVEI
jgi:hypothetical protein